MQNNIRLAVIYGSARPGRFGDTVVRWAEAEIAEFGGFDVDVIDPADPGVAGAIHGGDEAAAGALRERIEAAEAFLVVTPEYNHSYPAPLKALIDAANREWHAKPAAFVSYGGISGGLRAVEHLRNVLAEVHAATLRDTVSFANAWDQFAEDGRLHRPDVPRKAMALLLARLAWWARALRQARREQPYAKVAA